MGDCVVLSQHGLLCNAIGFSFVFYYLGVPISLLQIYFSSGHHNCLSSWCLLCNSGANSFFPLSRYLKRGVNEKGRVANDVETEQILFEDVPEDFPVHISSAVQNRGSIPLFWSQETSRLNIKPDIICMFKQVHAPFVRI